ncbi:hypothetical protein PL8927_370002 [Planktothrix serta PCC 8927]|uniref:Uncharacterized protein n=1 Tax=Planktothrix serta PCC 8927 TaxID=671068 RepID=A0A7Z9BMI5_9CYAN|nr:hypothetical protein PL8927_370002 [Planktothrix serta PCC 8927]
MWVGMWKPQQFCLCLIPVNSSGLTTLSGMQRVRRLSAQLLSVEPLVSVLTSTTNAIEENVLFKKPGRYGFRLAGILPQKIPGSLSKQICPAALLNCFNIIVFAIAHSCININFSKMVRALRLHTLL